MAVNWGFAFKVGGVGFGVVFLVLVILAVAVWLTGLVIHRFSPGEGKTEEGKKGA